MKNIIYISTLLMIFHMSSCKNSSDKNAETEHHHEEEGRVELTSAQYKTAGIQFGKVEKKNMSAVVQVNGMLDVPPQNMVSISALMGGFIKSTELLQGMQVKKGQVLAVIQNPEFIQIQQDYLDNKSKLKFAEQEYKRQEELAKENVAAQKTFQQASAEYHSLKAINSGLLEKLSLLGINPVSVENGEIRSTVAIVSPINGYVTTVNVNVGKYVNPQDVICEIVDTHHMHVELTVFEKDISKLKIGQKVRFVLVNESEKERAAEIYLINRKIAEDRTVRVHAHLDKEDPLLLPNMYLKAWVEITDYATTVLPNEAIVSSGDEYYIFVKAAPDEHEHEKGEKDEAHEAAGEHEEEYAFSAIKVQKGITQGNYTEVILPDGFKITEAEVVTKGAYDLLAKMNNSEEEGHAH